MKTFGKYLLSFTLILIATTAFGQSCPMCKESMTAAGAKLSEGFYYSILSMFFLPISLIGGGTFVVMKNTWLKDHPEAAEYSTVRIVAAMIREKRGR
ncbi:MAG: hypothetical protein WCH46_01930 [bacterium]